MDSIARAQVTRIGVLVTVPIRVLGEGSTFRAVDADGPDNALLQFRHIRSAGIPVVDADRAGTTWGQDFGRTWADNGRPFRGLLTPQWARVEGEPRRAWPGCAPCKTLGDAPLDESAGSTRQGPWQAQKP